MICKKRIVFNLVYFNKGDIKMLKFRNENVQKEAKKKIEIKLFLY